MKTVITTIALFMSLNSHAKILSQSNSHFVIGEEIYLSKSINNVWQHLKQIELWWDAEHSYSGDAKNLYLDLDKQFCFCEKWSQGWIQHLKVVNVIEEKKLVLRGGLGPLQSQSINAVLDINLSNDKGKVRLNWTYRVYGYVDAGLDKWAPAVNGVVDAQFNRLKQQIDTK